MVSKMNVHKPSDPALSAALALEMKGISKRFPGVVALDDVNLDLKVGEVLALVGENGAGKSTLMKILSGAYRADDGSVRLFGNEIDHATPLRMLQLGVAVIYQELLLAKHLTVTENIFLGRLPRHRIGTVNWTKARHEAQSVINRLGFDIDPDAQVMSLSVAHRQIVEIAKALSRNARVLVLDEPSAVLGDSELEKLFEIIAALSSEGVSFIYISHRLEEVFTISERTVVLRDGRLVGALPTSGLNKETLVQMMVGRELTDIYPKRKPNIGTPLLALKHVSNAHLHNVSVSVKAGEIVGVCGLAGAGRTELLRAICGADHATVGQFSMHGTAARPLSPKAALECGIGLLPEDRRMQGLFADQSVAFNVTLAKLRNVTQHGFLSRPEERRIVRRFIDRLRIKTPGMLEKIANLSGGNQQKCVLARLLNAQCRVLLIDEPTRGVDIGAKREIYQVLSQLADEEGIGILMVSSELPEIIGLCDRSYVMRDGRVTGEFSRTDVTEEKIMHVATD